MRDFTSLFPQAIFKSLFFKVVNAAQLGSSPQEPTPSAVPGSLNPLFAEPAKPVTSIPPLFIDVIKKQWLHLGQLRSLRLQIERTLMLHRTWLLSCRCLQSILLLSPYYLMHLSPGIQMKVSIWRNASQIRCFSRHIWQRLGPSDRPPPLHSSINQLCYGCSSFRTSFPPRTHD